MKMKYKILIAVVAVLFIGACLIGTFIGYKLLQSRKNPKDILVDLGISELQDEDVSDTNTKQYTYSSIPVEDHTLALENNIDVEVKKVEEEDKYVVQILSLSLIPLKDGKIDTEIANNSWGEYVMTLDEVKAKVALVEQGVIDALEEGTCYKKYKSSDCEEALSYEVFEHKDILEAGPVSDKPSPFEDGVFIADYNKLLLENSICNYVDNKGVYEVWIWDHTGINRSAWTSNFSSRYGDFSNSDGDPGDMPICEHSYTVYEYNYGRDVDVAVQDHIFQFERIFSALNYDLFWNRFVGYYPGYNSSELLTQTRRCGWANFAPNSETDFDWANENSVKSDCMNWNPDEVGKLSEVNCKQWGCTSEGYFLFWMQNIPGIDNDILFEGNQLRNFWVFIGDFDKAVEMNPDLVK